MRRFLIILSLTFYTVFTHAQVKKRMIFIGDAGKVTPHQTTLISDASSKVIPGKTTAVYLGNNIYPHGMPVNEGGLKQKAEEALDSQFKPMRNQGAQVQFIPGNRDWNGSRKHGLARVKAQWDYIKKQNDSLLTMQPEKGCPGPQVTPIDDDLLMVTLDTEWWLFPFDKENKEGVCENVTEKEVETQLREILFNNLDKTILLVTHHPSKSYGNHGGKYSWKEHLFPLTAIQKDLYLPLPGIGSLYPLNREAFPGKEDLEHPTYTKMIRKITKLFRGFPNVVQVSSHDNGLQLIRNPEAYLPTQVVSGIGNKLNPYTTNDKNSYFNASHPGYVIADWTADKSIHFKFFVYKAGTVEKRYEFTKDYTPFDEWTSPVYTPVKTDSVTTAVHPEYEDLGKFARFLLGENFRDAWATPSKLPVLQVSDINGGLKMRKLGGGQQTRNLRMKDSTGRQYALRTVEKIPDRVLPDEIWTPLTREVMEDAYSSQHPFSALMVPPIANAVDVPHTDPVIGYTAPDKNLGKYYELFAGNVNLLERWEPYRPTDNYNKGMRKLLHDNDNTFDADNFLKARMLDALIGDWDRHLDQWRFHDMKRGTHKNYLIVPRDRDMVLNLTQGLVAGFYKYFVYSPHIYGFKGSLTRQIKQDLFKSEFLDAHPANQLNYDHYMALVHKFTDEVTDSVLETSVNKMPEELDPEEEEEILNNLKTRRDEMPESMEKYYKYNNKIVDIRGTNRKEYVRITDLDDKDGLNVFMQKIDKYGELQDTLMSKDYPRSITKEIRIYLEKDIDSVTINNKTSSIKLRIIGGKPRHDSHKSYNVINSKNNIKVYDYKKEHYFGKADKLKTHISKDTANTSFIPIDMHHGFRPKVNTGFNRDDGFWLGFGGKFIQRRGFRKRPYVASHEISLRHYFGSNSYDINYHSDWTDVIGRTNLIVDFDLQAPKGSQNFFGIGNESPYDKTGRHHRYNQARFGLYTLKTGFKRGEKEDGVFRAGPLFQYYHYNPRKNKDRFIEEGHINYSYDRHSISENKLHLGFFANYEIDKRDNKILPTKGFYAHAGLLGQAGLNSASKAYLKFKPEFSFYKSINPRKSLVIADRIGGAVTAGHPAFYQYAYLGGKGNLLGYRQNRFAGKYAIYNNLELRFAAFNFGNSVFKGQLGIKGFYDIGRVWVPHEHSHKWHNGVGGGLYFAPAYSTVLDFSMGYGENGWYPYLSFGFRF